MPISNCRCDRSVFYWLHMRQVLRWSHRVLPGLISLLIVAWAVGEVLQWRMRWRAEKLLDDVRSLQVNRSTDAEARALLQKWARWGSVQTYCREDGCNAYVVVRRWMPEFMQAEPIGKAPQWLASLIDLTGLRASDFSARFDTKNGLVTGTGFTESIGLPVRDWYSRDGAYVPDLMVSSGESTEFNDHEREAYVQPTHPHRIARRMKGPYGVFVKFTPKEMPAEKAALMDFHFGCVTQFIPCKDESEILPEGVRLLDQQE